jgi:hypothetical protein
LGFWYNWVQYKDRFDSDQRQLVRCGDNIPILWLDRKDGALLGYLDKTEVAHFSHDKVAEQVQGVALNTMYIITREFKGGKLSRLSGG